MKAWCCLYEGIGCPTDTVTRTTQSSTATTTSRADAADVLCHQAERRVLWLSEHGLEGRRGACAAARRAVLRECRACEVCALDEAPCIDGSGSSRPSGSECLAGVPPADREWCCDNFGAGCLEAPAQLAFNCTTGLTEWQTDWSVEKKTWCCEHEGRGCPPRRSLRTAAVRAPAPAPAAAAQAPPGRPAAAAAGLAAVPTVETPAAGQPSSAHFRLAELLLVCVAVGGLVVTASRKALLGASVAATVAHKYELLETELGHVAPEPAPTAPPLGRLARQVVAARARGD